MKSSEVGHELLEALRGLRGVVQDLRQDIERPLARHEVPLERLRATIAALGPAQTTKILRCPDEYVQHWQKLLAGRPVTLTTRAIRYLCWEPKVATSPQFQDYLKKSPNALSAQSLQGLVRSCHALWSTPFAANPVVHRVRLQLERYQGQQRILCRWKDAATMLLGPAGHKEFAIAMVVQCQAIEAYCATWAVEETSLYVQEAMRWAVQDCHERMQRDVTWHQYLLTVLLSWTGWLLQDFKAAVGATILHPVVAETPAIQESLTRFVLSDLRLRDPRLPRNTTNWLGVSEEARLRLIQWLSKADITFFFEHAFRDKEDRQGRKTFWLRYVPRVLMSRPLLNQKDEASLQTTIRQIREQIGHFGRINPTSAFLLDFGPIVVVEFSESGNACFVYKKSDFAGLVKDFWTSQPFTVERLKSRYLAAARVRHIRGGGRPVWPIGYRSTTQSVMHRQRWQEEMANILASYGIRPS